MPSLPQSLEFRRMSPSWSPTRSSWRHKRARRYDRRAQKAGCRDPVVAKTHRRPGYRGNCIVPAANDTAMIVAASAQRHTDLMTLFLPNARATNWLLIVGFCSIGFALYMRYLAVEQSTVGLACQAELNTWLCFTRQITIVLFTYSVFGWFALIVAALNFIRPSLVLFSIALAATCCGVVLYNVGLSSLAAGLLVVSLSRRAPEPD